MIPSSVLFQARTDVPFALLILRRGLEAEAKPFTRVVLVTLHGAGALVLCVRTLTESGDAYDRYYPVDQGMSWEIR